MKARDRAAEIVRRDNRGKSGGRRASRWLGAALGLALLAGGIWVAGSVATRSSSVLPLPDPDLSHLDERTRSLIGQRRPALEAVIRSRGEKVGLISEASGDLGKLYLACKLTGAAEACLMNAQSLASGDPRWPSCLGYLYRTSNQPEKAIACYERVLRLQPGDLAALVWLGRLHLDRNEPEKAEPLFRMCLEIQPSSPSALYGLGRIAMSRRDFAAAVQCFEKALSISPQATIVHYSLAIAYREMGETGKTQAHLALRGDVEPYPYDPLLEELQRILPDPKLHADRGIRAFDAGRWREAAVEFRTAVEADPTDPVLRVDLGGALAKVGDQASAMEQFQQALRLSPGNARALLDIGSLLERLGSRSEAIRYFRSAVAADLSFPEARLALADELQRQGKYEEALPHFRKAIELDPRSAEARLGEAMTLLRLRRYSQAKRSLEESLGMFPERPEFAHSLARLLTTCPEKSLRDGLRALKLLERLPDPGADLEIAQTMAMALAEAGRYDQAVQWQRRCIDSARRAGRSRQTARMEERLALYERAKPCREFWSDELEAPPSGR